MDDIRLLNPSMEYDEDIMNFRQELFDSHDNDSFAGCGGLEKCSNTKEWLDRLSIRADAKKCPPDKVMSNTYLAVRMSDNRIVGIIDLRHHINHPVLSLWGGHIGYSIRPSERRKGYGKEMLKLDLQKCRERNMKKVMITCNRDNIASEKTIIANGGIFEKEVYVNGEYIKRYWITL